MTETAQEIRVPEAEISRIAEKSLRPDLDAIKAAGEKALEAASSHDERIAAMEKTIEAINRVHEENAKADSHVEDAGLYFDPSDMSSPVVRHFGLATRKDRINVPNISARSAGFVLPYTEAKGLGLRPALYLQARANAARTQRTVEATLKQMGAEWMIKDLNLWVERDGGIEVPNGTPITVEKALGTVNAVSGGTMLPPEYAQEWIDLLRNLTTFLAANPDEMTLPPGGLQMGRWTAPSVAYYRNEQSAVNASQPSTGEFVMTPRNLIGVVPVSNNLLAEASTAARIRGEMIKTLQQRLDLAGLRGLGTSDTPRGIRYWITDGSTPDRVQASAPSTSTTSTADLATDMKLVSGLLPRSNAGRATAVFVNPRTEEHLYYHHEAGSGLFPFQAEIAAGRLARAPLFSTNQMPVNLGGGSDGEIMAANMEMLVHGIMQELVVEVFPDGTYQDSSGSLQSGISREETAFRATYKHDIRPKHEEFGMVLTGVKY